MLVGFCCVFGLTTGCASSQDLFELEVFEYETTPPHDYEIQFHTNGVSRGSIAAGTVIANHRPIHLSVEVTRGWTNRFETAVFIQSAPFGSRGSARFAGGHVRGKLRLGVTIDYFSAAATTRHLQPEPRAHHLIFAGADLDVGSGWKLGIGAGHCVTSGEPWVMKSAIGYSF